MSMDDPQPLSILATNPPQRVPGGPFEGAMLEASALAPDRMACCRFHGHRVKVFLPSPEGMNAKTTIQLRV